MRKIATLAACTVLLFASVIAGESVNAAQTETCFMIVTEHWPQSTQSNPQEVTQARDRVFNGIGVLIASAYKNGGYERNPTSFPVHHTDFRDDHIVIDFRTSCPRARLFLSELLQAYRRRLSAKEKAIGPDLVIEDRPATEYEARCGVGATAATCE